jgi:hypothetical protein
MRSAFALVSLAALILVLTPALGGAAAAQVGSEFAPILLPSSVTFPVMLYAVAAYGRGREPVLALGVAVVGAMITTLRLWDPGTWTTGVPTGNGWRLFILISSSSPCSPASWPHGRSAGFAACTRPTSAPSSVRACWSVARAADHVLGVP